MLIYLLGYMGCGKSTLGRKLSKALDLQYIDLDLLIEEKENCSISNIFTFMGEEYFRKCELAILEEVSLKENAIVSLGGGTPCYKTNMEIIKKSGKSIYLKLPTKALFQRLTNSKKPRPLIAKIGKENLLALIENQLSERQKFYVQADKIFDMHEYSAKQIIDEIRKLL